MKNPATRAYAYATLFIAAVSSIPFCIAHADGDLVKRNDIDETIRCAIARPRDCSIKTAIARGLFQTGLKPQFAADAQCRGIDEAWAIDYTYKRNRENYHGGIDIPAPFGTPIHAIADGTVAAIYDDPQSFRGIEIFLRHTPDDTGIPLYIYTDYAHLQKPPTLVVGDRVKMGDIVGLTGNTGRTPERRARHRRRFGRGGDDGPGFGGGGPGRGAFGPGPDGPRRRRGRGRRGHGGDGHGHRRPAVHLAVFFSASPQYAVLKHAVVPADGSWMDPNALFRAKPPFDSASMKALPPAEKRVPIPYMLADRSVHPGGSKLIWPYPCSRR